MSVLSYSAEIASQRVLPWIARSFGAKVNIVPGAAAATLVTQSGVTLRELPAITKALVAHRESELLGSSPVQVAQVTAWLRWCFASPPASAPLDAVEVRLAAHSYMAGESFTVADAVVYWTVNPALHSVGASAITTFPSIYRWLAQFYVEPAAAGAADAEGAPPRIAVPPLAPLRLLDTAAPTAAVAGAAKLKKAGGKGDKAGTPSPAPAAAVGTGAEAAPAAAAAPEAEAPAARPAKVKAPKAAAPAAAAPPAPAAVEDPITACDFRVGLIVKAWVHPSADRLYCEEIDLGEEGGPRQIASGLREHYTLEQMSGRRVVVAANLKPRALAGFTSNGMVLCATTPEGKVEFVEPPVGAPLGERVAFAGHEGPAVDPKKMDKGKFLEKVLPDLKVNDALIATYAGVPFSTSAGPCTVPTARGGSIR